MLAFVFIYYTLNSFDDSTKAFQYAQLLGFYFFSPTNTKLALLSSFSLSES